MRAVLLVAVREIRQVIGTRGFWVMLLIVPFALAVSGFASSKLGPERSSAFTIVDRTGRYAPEIERRVELGYQQAVLRGLSEYVARWNLAGADPRAPWSNRQGWLAEGEVQRFVERGGAEAAIRELRPHLPQGAPEFDPPERFFVAAPAPAGVPTDQGPQVFGKAIEGALQNDVLTAHGSCPTRWRSTFPTITAGRARSPGSGPAGGPTTACSKRSAPT